MCNQNCNQGRSCNCRLPRCIDDGYDNVGCEYDPEVSKWKGRALEIAAVVTIVLLLCLEIK